MKRSADQKVAAVPSAVAASAESGEWLRVIGLFNGAVLAHTAAIVWVLAWVGGLREAQIPGLRIAVGDLTGFVFLLGALMLLGTLWAYLRAEVEGAS